MARHNKGSRQKLETWTLEEPRGPNFIGLLRASMRYADRACLITPEIDEGDAEYRAVVGRLQPFLLHPSIVTHCWPGTPKGSASKLSTYRLCSGLIEILTTNVSGWFDWQLPRRPEDLSLLRGKDEWLVSATHERLIYLRSERRDLFELLETVPGLRVKSGPGFRAR